MSNAINPKGPRVVIPGQGAVEWATTYLCSTVGQKILVAITGASLTLFVIFHLIGNLKFFNGQAAINHYANFLKHDLGLLIWIARAGLLGAFGVHLFLAISLKLKSTAARPIGYFSQRSAQATPQSKTMIWTGIVVLMFVLFHLAHYTFAWVHTAPNGQSYLDLKDSQGYHDVYTMMVVGFKTWWISALYLIAQAFLFVHLAHGIQSVFQTLGLVGKKFTPAVKLMGYGISGLIFAGNSAIVLAILLK